MNSLKELYRLCFYLIILVVFMIGGLMQFLFGVSNTGITFVIVAVCYMLYFIYVLFKQKIVLNRVVFFAGAYILFIFISAIINGSDIISTNVYLLFPLLPLGVFLFCFINHKENFISYNKILKLFYYIALLQLPFLLLQTYFYNYFIQFNNSGQIIASFDFRFGTFFVKSDHSLAIFLLFIITNILLNRRKFRDKLRHPWISVIYLSVSVFYTESNISKFFLVVLLCVSILFPIYKKHRHTLKFKAIVVVMIVLLGSIGYNLKESEFLEKRFGGALERQFSVKTAERQYNLGTAKRSQILIVMINKLDVKWLGDGPYSYFDIRTGEFRNTQHFTQIIWTYFDLGLVGLLIMFLYIFSIVRYLDIDKGLAKKTFIAVILVYSFYTTIFSDIAIMLSLIIIFNRKVNEPNHNTISRLEEK